KKELLSAGLDGLRKISQKAQDSHIADGLMGEAYQRMGDVFQSIGNYGEARQQYEHAHPIFVKLAQANPSDDGQRLILAKALDKLGDVGVLEGDHDAARKHYTESLRLREALSASGANNIIA